MAGNRLPQTEIDKRIKECYDLRFNNSEIFRFKAWVEYCHTNYEDKSEQQYTDYWMKAGELYQEGWKEMLNKQLTPAVHELIRLLADENPKIRHEAAKSIFKYTGNEVQRIEANVTGEIVVNFTND